MKLTKATIDRATYAGGAGEKPRKDIRWDDKVAGMGLRVYPSGKKSFVLFYRHLHRQHVMTLGQYGVLTLDQARAEARAKLAEVATGRDPLATRERDRRRVTVADLCDAYITRHAKTRKRSWREDESRIRRRLLPSWGGLPAQSITRADVASMHQGIGATSPYEANRVLALVRKMFNLALQWGFLGAEGGVNPALGIDHFAEVKRDRWVTPAEFPRLGEAIRSEENPYVRAALLLYLHTGARKSELLKLRWKDVHLDRAEICFPDTKSRRRHYVPLTAAAQQVLAAVPKLAGNDYVFPGAKSGQHLVNISKPWSRIRARAGISDVRIHDLRRTLGSWMAQRGASLHLIGCILNHSNPSTTAVYARFGQDHGKAALDACSNDMALSLFPAVSAPASETFAAPPNQ